MPRLLRIFSDLHFGDPSSRLGSLAALRPLFDGADELLLNGDTLDTRPSSRPARTAALHAEVKAFFQAESRPAVLLTGNHDPAISTCHAREFADRQVLVTHGDILFDELVPWGRDASLLRKVIAEEMSRLTPAQRESFDARLEACRRAAARIPQRHQAEPRGWRHALGFLADTVWPPTRILRVLRAWQETPARADALLSRHQLPARFLVMGHTHRLGATLTPGGRVLLNTGSFCPPTGVGVVDLTPDRITLRAVDRRGGGYRLGASLADFTLART